MMPDYPLGETLDFKFTTRAFATGIPTTLAGTPVIQIYEDNSDTQITAGITLTADFDSVTGLNNLRIVATGGNGFEAGKSYSAVISTGTVGGVSVVGEVVAQFSIERSPVNWANVTAPTTAVDLSGTDIQLVDTCSANTDMRGTDNAALASVLGALADAAADGDPTAADTLMQYIKQLVNVLVGATGVVTYPAESAPGNNVSFAEILRAVYNDTVGLNGDAMRGTNGANTVVPDAAGVAPTAIEIRQEMDTNSVDLDQIQADIGALNNIDSADVLTQVNAALDTAISELGVAVPTATPTLRTGLMLMYMALRNRTVVQTSGTDALEIHNDAGTLITKKLLTDDGSDYIEAEMS